MVIKTGLRAAGHLEAYRGRISQNFELPIHIGRLVAQWDEPEFVPAPNASRMRDHDYVVGLVHKGVAVAFPMWVADNYHVINCMIAGDPVVYTTCERCQSGSAFLSLLDGKPVKFSALGMYNASLTMTDRADFLQRDGSLWLHYEGVCIDGKHRGTFLAQIPTFHTMWAEWKTNHADSLVLIEPRDRHHRDARHGHGREEYFARPGMDPPLVLTITGEFDERYPENEIVLGVNSDEMTKAYPLKEVKKSGSVVHDRIGDVPIVVLAGPRPEQVTMAAYSCLLDGRALTFGLDGAAFVDRETRSMWDIEGLALEGPLAGRRLEALRWQYVRWHAWFYPHRGTRLYLHERTLPAYPGSNPDVGSFRPILDGLTRLERPMTLEGAVFDLSLPHEAPEGLTLRVGNDRLNLYRFNMAEAAEDYVQMEGAWFCFPISKKVGKRYSRRVGVFVIESDPENQYADPSQFVRLPDPAIAWSDIVTDVKLDEIMPPELLDGAGKTQHGFAGLFECLRRATYDVVETAFLPHTQLRFGTLNAVAATINADRFAIYKCPDGEPDPERGASCDSDRSLDSALDPRHHVPGSHLRNGTVGRERDPVVRSAVRQAVCRHHPVVLPRVTTDSPG